MLTPLRTPPTKMLSGVPRCLDHGPGWAVESLRRSHGLGYR